MTIARCLALALFASAAAVAAAGDWPQILGENRDGVARGERLADHWPPAGPAVEWRREVGAGYAGPIVARTSGGKRLVVIYHRERDQTLAEGLDPASGKNIWRTAFPTRFAPQIGSDDGPRSAPLAHGDRLILFGAEGDLHCLALESGQTLWSRRLGAELSAPPGYFGFGSSPIVVGDRVLVNVGGTRGAGIVALDLADGKTLWKNTDEAASYSSPVAAAIDGRPRVIFVTRLNLVSLDPATGAVDFRIPFGSRGPTVNAANPVLFDGHLFVTANYGVGARLLKLKADRADAVWSSDDLLSSQFATPVFHNGVLYGIDGRQDVGVARLRAIDPLAERVLWTEENFGMATLILADGKLLAMKVDGTLVLLAARPDAYHELARARLFDTTTQPLPALAEGFLYARDTGTLKCVDVGRR